MMATMRTATILLLAALPAVTSYQPNSAVPRRTFISTTGAAAAAAAASTAAPSSALAASPLVKGDESLMKAKAHGTTELPVQEKLRFAVDRKTADRICSYNRMFAERAGYYLSTSFVDELDAQPSKTPLTFYDSVSGKPLFKAPVGRSVDDFLQESYVHGWPSFRDNEVVWDNVRILKDGETVSVDGTHLGHNLPDRTGNRYCINLVSVAGNPV
eukprot:CAMPEP_0119519876 /NCGR_PEP_ID=MMETSP1344-20130328/36039_1 /TAXON_ID=236787 /ORGANISM="Florenciella parvula, Strain CCMP2471" /LENGTH=213 /DNA_ID=CAMNT_0007557701 /DNA_START=31 /DNA_END=672 /DNA_ORIENTATION=+